MNKPIRIIFAGTPDFSAPYLEGLIADSDFSVLGVITQSDKPSGRKQELSPSPVKIIALEKGLRIWQPEKLRKDETIAGELEAIGADMLVVVAYGQIIPQNILDLFPRGAINVHPSLLPKYRGASPIQSAILNGDSDTGITIMLMDEKMDHGPILAQERFVLTGDETNESLHAKLAPLGVRLLIGTIKRYLAGKIKPQPQDDSQATLSAAIAKEDGRINWESSAQLIKQRIFAFHPWPGTWTTLEGRRMKIFPPVIVMDGESDGSGRLQIVDSELVAGCGNGRLILTRIQLEGKGIVSAKDFMRGHKEIEGKNLI